MRISRLGVTFILILLLSLSASALTLVDSQDWKDTYSVMLYGGMTGDKAMFVNSESLGALTKVMPPSSTISVYESSSNPFIRNVDRQLASAGYTIAGVTKSNAFNLDLVPEDVTNFILVADDNSRISVALAPYAISTRSWVFFVGDDTVNEVVGALEGAQSVIAVGNFRRDIWEQVQPFVTESINTQDVFLDSQAIASRFSDFTSVLLADGTFLEQEFFATKNPVLLTGGNKILDSTYSFLVEHDVKSVVLVGNSLSVVGEQIRTRSNKEIGVFIKFGQSGVSNDGTVYALSLYQLPPLTIGLTVNKAVYRPSTRELIVFYQSTGTSGLYELSTLSVKTGDDELASASDEEALYLGPGEQLAVTYPDMNIPLDRVTDQTVVEFFTSYGIQPTGLDNFLTMTNQYGPPFSIPLTIDELDLGEESLDLLDAAYYTSLKRVGADFSNTGTETVYYSVKVNNLIVNGLKQTLFKEDSISAGETKTTYLPVALDQVDLEENTELSVTVTYGASPDVLVRTISKTFPFTTRKGGLGLTGLFTGVEGAGMRIVTIALLIALIAGTFLYIRKRRNRNS